MEATHPKPYSQLRRESKNVGPFATRTVLGWVLNGPLGRRTSQARTANFVEADVELNQQFERFCDLEFNDSIYDPKTSMSQNDKRALNVMESTAKLTNGHYEIALPWKNYPPCLKNNKSLAENRLKPLKRRLERDPAILVKYKEVMEDKCAVTTLVPSTPSVPTIEDKKQFLSKRDKKMVFINSCCIMYIVFNRKS